MTVHPNHFLLSLMLCCFIPAASHADEESTKPTVVAPTVTVSKAVISDISERTAISGTLVAAEEVYINTRINGYAIEQLNVDIGDAVKKGDVLAVLDTLNLKSQVLQAEAEFARTQAAIAQADSQIIAAEASNREAQLSLNRTKRLRRQGHISQQELDKAIATSSTTRANLTSVNSGLQVSRAQSKQANLRLEIAKNNQARARIRTPVDGIISGRSARLGNIANAGGEPLFKIIRDGIVEMEAEIIETALSGIRLGQAVEIDIAGIGKIKGSVRLIAPTVDARTRLAKVRIKLPKRNNLRPGLSGSGWIIGNKRQALTVPASAITTEDGNVVVSLVKDGLVEKRQVVAGDFSIDGRREVTSGLTHGEVVMTKSGVFYRAGDAVKTIGLAAESSIGASIGNAQ